MKDNRVFILSHTIHHARDYAKIIGLEYENFRYVSRKEMLHGLRGKNRTICVVGDITRIRDLEEILLLAKMRGFELFYTGY